MEHLDQQINKEAPLEEAIERVLDELLKNPQLISPTEVTHLTGIGYYEADIVLREIMKRYPCKLEASEKGELIYDFDLKDRLPPPLPFGYYTKRLLGFIFRIWLVLMLYTIGTLYGIMISFIALFLGAPQVFGYFVSGLFFGIKELINGVSSYWSPTESLPLEAQKPSLLKDISAYAFGQAYTQDNLYIERRILRYLRRHDYVITNAELISLTGWNWNKAREEATNLVVQYSGTVEVSETGYILYRFDAIKPTEAEKEALEKEAENSVQLFIWDMPLYRHGIDNLNSQIRFYITLVVGTTFTMAAIYSIFADPSSDCFWELSIDSFMPWHSNAFCISFWSSYFPLLFCFIYLNLGWNLQKRDIELKSKIDKKQLQNRFLQLIFDNLPKVFDKDLTPLETKMMDELRVDLEGFPAVDEEGNTYNEFVRINEELKARNNASTIKTSISTEGYEPIKEKRFLLPADREKDSLSTSKLLFWVLVGAVLGIVYLFYWLMV